MLMHTSNSVIDDELLAADEAQGDFPVPVIRRQVILLIQTL